MNNYKNSFTTYDLESLLKAEKVYLNHINTILSGDNHLHQNEGILQNNPSGLDLSLCEAIVSKLLHSEYFLIEYDRVSEPSDCAYTIHMLNDAQEAYKAHEEEAVWLRKLGAQTMAVLNPECGRLQGVA